jgi:pentatricopeptide repeat protein
MKIKQTVSTVNALITALCDGDQLQKAVEVLFDMKGLGFSPNSITYSILLVASEKYLFFGLLNVFLIINYTFAFS